MTAHELAELLWSYPEDCKIEIGLEGGDYWNEIDRIEHHPTEKRVVIVPDN